MVSQEPHFSSDGSEIFFLSVSGISATGVWSIPVTGGESTQLVAFDDPSLTVYRTLTVGPDHFYLSVAEYESDIWVMDLEWEQ